MAWWDDAIKMVAGTAGMAASAVNVVNPLAWIVSGVTGGPNPIQTFGSSVNMAVQGAAGVTQAAIQPILDNKENLDSAANLAAEQAALAEFQSTRPRGARHALCRPRGLGE